MNKKKIILSIIIFVAVFALAGVAKTQAISLKGWLWGGTEDPASPENCYTYPAGAGCIDGDETGVGWISINSRNCDIDGNHIMNRSMGDAVAPIGCPADGTNIVDYYVQIPPADGDLLGYGWSVNLGYIDFNPQDHCTTGIADATHYTAASCTDPGGGTGGVSRSGNDLSGWARIVDIAKASATGNSGGWTGWIKLKGPSYGVAVSGSNLTGYAWSSGDTGTELGAIDFGRAYFPPPADASLWGGGLINIRTTAFPFVTKLHWSSTNATSCSVTSSGSEGSSWTTSPLPGTSGDSPDLSFYEKASMTYKVTCTGDGGEGTPGISSVYAICYPKKCNSSNECVEDTSIMTYSGAAAVLSDCDAASTCSNDYECAKKTPGVWKEVEP